MENSLLSIDNNNDLCFHIVSHQSIFISQVIANDLSHVLLLIDTFFMVDIIWLTDSTRFSTVVAGLKIF